MEKYYRQVFTLWTIARKGQASPKISTRKDIWVAHSQLPALRKYLYRGDRKRGFDTAWISVS